MIYLVLIIGAVCVSAVFFPLAKWVANRYNVMDIPNIRNIHHVPVPRTGGLILCLTFLSILFVADFPVFGFNVGIYIAWWHVLSVFLIFAVGFIDDLFTLGFQIRLILQLLISIFFVVASGMYLTNYGFLINFPAIFAIPFTVFCIMGVTNAYNIIDGLDGLSAGCGLIFFMQAAFLAYKYDSHSLILFAVLFAGCLLGFIIYNFPSAKIFLGDGGSYLIGFSIATMAIIILKEHPEISPWALLLMTFVPVFDTSFAIARRKRKKRSPFKADKRHLHHILRRRYRSDTRAVIVIWSLQFLTGALALYFHKNTLVLVVITVLSVLFLKRLWIKPLKFGGIRI